MTTTFIWEKVRFHLGKVSTPTLLTAQAKKLLATAAFLVFIKFIKKTNKEKVTFLVFIRFIKN